MITRLASLAVVAFAISTPGFAGDHGAAYSGSIPFEKMKSLAGSWHGLAADKQHVVIQYRVSSAGSSVVETLFPGTPKEMVSIYHDEGKKLKMTHYCALKNQPEMALKSASNDSLELDFSGGSNVNPEKDMHMHSLKIEFKGDDHLIHHWKTFKDGKEVMVSTFNLTRVR